MNDGNRNVPANVVCERLMSAPDPSLDAYFMAVAFALGGRGLGRTWPNPAVGAVVVRDNGAGPVVVGRGWTQPGGRPHAETQALQKAGEAACGATLYVTLEPCSHHGRTPPCCDAIVDAGITRVVSAMVDPNPQVAGAGHWRLASAGITVEVGLGAQEAQRAHAGHLRRLTDGRPHVTLKLAVSRDGKAGLAGRRPAVITGERARESVHLMRATHDAVLTGIGTVLSDNPQLTCRLTGMSDRSPVRVVLDRMLGMAPDCILAKSARETPVWVLAGEAAPESNEQALSALGVSVIRIGTRYGALDLSAALCALADRGITRVMVEAGPRLSAAFLSADLVDAAVLFRSPRGIGVDGIDALEGMSLDALTCSPGLTLAATEAVGDDMVETFERR